MNIMKFLTPKSQVAYVFDDATLRQTIEKMKHHGYASLPVIRRDGTYVGTIREGEILLFISRQEQNTNLGDVWKLPLSAVENDGFNPPLPVDAAFKTVLRRLAEQSFLAVTDDRGALVGIITKKDVIRFLAENLPDTWE